MRSTVLNTHDAVMIPLKRTLRPGLWKIGGVTWPMYPMTIHTPGLKRIVAVMDWLHLLAAGDDIGKMW